MNRDGDRGKVFNRRAAIVAGGKLALFTGLLGRMYYLQVIEADKYKTLADENRISMRLLAPPRGLILDRNNIPLAINVPNFRAILIPEQAGKEIDNTLKLLGHIIPISSSDIAKIHKKIKSNRRKFVPITIRENLSWEDMAKIQVNAPDLPGIMIDEGLSRNYPFNALASHVLGYVSSVSTKDLKNSNDPLLEISGFRIGKAGVEKVHDKNLRGKAGSQRVEVNAVGRVIKEIERNEGKPGSEINLSIDINLQKKAEELLGKESGAIVVVDVETGELLVLASTPSFNPNDFNQGISNKDWNKLINNPKTPLINKAIAGLYSPGSTFKMVVAIAALEAGVINPTKKIYCGGHIDFGGHRFHCWKKEGHGPVNMIEAIQHSCDIYFYEIAKKVGIDKIAEIAERFGLGQELEIDLLGEKKGLIPTKDWKIKALGEPWQHGETMIAGIGQGYVLTTPLQLAIMTARIANGGKAIKPTLIKGKTENKEKPTINKINVPNSYLNIVKKGMYAVVNEIGGTALGSRFNIKGQRMCGKTGTTQVRRISMKERETGVLKQEELAWRERNHALFVGFAPQDNPRFAVSVLVEHGGSGSQAAAPLASKILQECLIRYPVSTEEIKENILPIHTKPEEL